MLEGMQLEAERDAWRNRTLLDAGQTCAAVTHGQHRLIDGQAREQREIAVLRRIPQPLPGVHLLERSLLCFLGQPQLGCQLSVVAKQLHDLLAHFTHVLLLLDLHVVG